MNNNFIPLIHHTISDNHKEKPQNYQSKSIGIKENGSSF